MLEYTRLRLDVKRAQADGLIEGYASTFGEVDLAGDVIAPGAFSESLKQHNQRGTMPSLLMGHDGAVPVGRWQSMREDAKGLLVTGKLDLNLDQGREAFALVKGGSVDGLSVGMQVQESEPTESGRLIRKAYLAEVSLVSVPCNQSARVALKSARGLERLLRNNGYSRKEAAAVVADGYAGIDPKQVQTEATIQRLTRLLISEE